jgi:hypothetical protein
VVSSSVEPMRWSWRLYRRCPGSHPLAQGNRRYQQADKGERRSCRLADVCRRGITDGDLDPFDGDDEGPQTRQRGCETWPPPPLTATGRGHVAIVA